ncbi:MAG: hypothetical protein M1835_005056 [Candelina submexicana]|nr:MAG: hypothetical protein M1835_005056 [Candelina submexicana]
MFSQEIKSSKLPIVSLNELELPVEFIKVALAKQNPKFSDRMWEGRDKLISPRSSTTSLNDTFAERLVRSSSFQAARSDATSCERSAEDPVDFSVIERVQRFMELKRTLWDVDWSLRNAENGKNETIRMEKCHQDLPNRHPSSDTLRTKAAYKHLIDNLQGQKEELMQMLEESRPSPEDCKLAIKAQIAQASKVPTTEDLSRLLKASTGPDEIRRVVDFACQTQKGGERLLEVSVDLRGALYHSRDFDHIRSARLFDSVASRLRSTVPKLNSDLIVAGMKYAIESHSWPSLRRYLLEYRDNGYRMNQAEFSSVLSKFSHLPNRHLSDSITRGWMRNSWPLLSGSSMAGIKADSGDDEVSLRWFLPVGVCDCFIKYVNALGYMKAREVLWREWLSWQKHSTNYSIPERDNIIEAFVNAFLHADDHLHAWMLVKDSKLTFGVLAERTWALLMVRPEAISFLPKGIDQVLLRSYHNHLSEIERTLHVEWVGGENGYHAPTSEP